MYCTEVIIVLHKVISCTVQEHFLYCTGVLIVLHRSIYCSIKDYLLYVFWLKFSTFIFWRLSLKFALWGYYRHMNKSINFSAQEYLLYCNEVEFLLNSV